MLRIQFEKQQGSFHLNVDIAAHSNDVVALFGKSGCGKSTTINLIAGLIPATRGRLELDGEVLFDSRTQRHVPTEQRRMGYVFQDARLFPHYSVLGNLQYGLQRAAKIPQRMAFDTVVALLDLGHLLQQHPHQLSGGEKQRVALARALLSQPRLLLLDEPLASLDQSRRAEVLPYLQQVRDELHIPMVYVSHQFEEVLQLATHVVLMQQGQIAAQGTLPAISQHSALREIVGAEAMGTVIESVVEHIDSASGLARVQVGTGHLNVDASTLRPGQAVRLQLLARDLILSLHPPTGMSVRNMLQGQITQLQADDAYATMVSVDVGGVTLIARVTRSAALELALHEALPLWVLVKAVTLRGHVYGRPA